MICFITCTLDSYGQQKLEKLEFLCGKWKVEGKATFETWEKDGNSALKGQSYKIKDGKTIVMETLSIAVSANQITYSATVANQNNGETIPFILNSNGKDQLSFENPKHDFPNKIQYKLLNKDEIFVQVLGKDGKGFSYKIIKQPR